MAYSPRAYAQVPSALRGLTSEFEMGSGVPLPLKSPRQYNQINNNGVENKNNYLTNYKSTNTFKIKSVGKSNGLLVFLG